MDSDLDLDSDAAGAGTDDSDFDDDSDFFVSEVDSDLDSPEFSVLAGLLFPFVLA